MTWPRKGTRTIDVEGQSFLWHVPDGRVGWAGDPITVGRDGASFVLHLDPLSWGGTPSPAIVAGAIRWALAKGWSPEAGPTRGVARVEPCRFVFLPPDCRRLPKVEDETLWFEVEHVLEGGRLVFAARLGDGDFELRSDTRFGGLLMTHHLTMPRATDPNGNPRFDLFAFEVLEPEGARKLLVGELVTLTPVDRHAEAPGTPGDCLAGGSSC